MGILFRHLWSCTFTEVSYPSVQIYKSTWRSPVHLLSGVQGIQIRTRWTGYWLLSVSVERFKCELTQRPTHFRTTSADSMFFGLDVLFCCYRFCWHAVASNDFFVENIRDIIKERLDNIHVLQWNYWNYPTFWWSSPATSFSRFCTHFLLFCPCTYVIKIEKHVISTAAWHCCSKKTWSVENKWIFAALQGAHWTY